MTKPGPSHKAITDLIMHPVMVVFIQEKWKLVKLSFYTHLRSSRSSRIKSSQIFQTTSYSIILQKLKHLICDTKPFLSRLWLLFLLTYSLFIRENLRRGLLRRTFQQLCERPPNSTIQKGSVCNHSVRGCLSVRDNCKDKIWTTSKISLQNIAPSTTNKTLNEIQRLTTICHPEERVDSSQISLYGLAALIAVLFLVKAWWVYHYFRKDRRGTRCTRNGAWR